MSIDREWHEPVYVQMAGILRDRIPSGEWRPAVPSRRCGPWSRPTASTAGPSVKALRVLADEGLVTVVKGRGWFVTPEGQRPR